MSGETKETANKIIMLLYVIPVYRIVIAKYGMTLYLMRPEGFFPVSK
jgi:hypothetical protein